MSRWKDAWNMLVRKLKIRRGASSGGFATSYVPATAVLVLSAFAPSVQASAPQTVTPTTRAVTITRYPPTATGPAPFVVTPTTRALVITERVPTVTASLHRLVTPTTKALLLTPNAPTINGAVGIIVPTRTLTVTKFAPTVTARANKIAVPTTRALTITERVPTVTSANHLVVTPTTKALATTRHIPTVTKTNHQRLIPTKRTLTLTRYAPTIGTGLTQLNVGAGAVGITVSANNTTIQNMRITGPGANVWHANSRGISGSGAYSNITIRNCIIEDFGYGGIILEHMSNVTIEDCTIEDVTYAGIMLMSIHGATVQRNTVRRVGVTSAHQQPDHNAYGIAITRSTSAQPPSEDIDVLRNVVEDVPLWHGIDAHGGNRLLVDHNTVRRTARALWMGYMPGGTQGAGGGGCEDSTYSKNFATEPQSQLTCPFGHTYGGTDANTAISSFDSLDCFITGNVVSTAYPNIHYDDVGNPSIGLTASGNIRGTALPP